MAFQHGASERLRDGLMAREPGRSVISAINADFRESLPNAKAT
jgi:hypothetical protein